MKKVKSQHIFLKVVMVVVVTAIVIMGFYKFGIISKDCEQDKECFSERLKECKPVRYDAVVNSNYYEYKVEGSKKDECILHVKLKKMGSGTPIEQVEFFEGKEMKCFIPKDELDLEMQDINNLLNYCTGNLKEAIYEHLITKMYGLVLKNMGPIIDEIDKTLK